MSISSAVLVIGFIGFAPVASAQTVTLNDGDTQTYTPTSSAASGAVDTRTFGGQATNDTSAIDFSGTADSVGTSTDLAIAAQPATTGTQLLGQLEITNGGAYTFNLNSDDGSRLFIDGVLVVNNEGAHGPTIRSGTVDLDAGLHEIRVEIVNNTAGGSLAVQYSGPDQATMGTIPATALYRAENAASVSTTVAPHTVVDLGDNIVLSNGAAATIALNGTAYSNAGLGNFTVGTASTLNLTGTANRDLRFDATTFSGASTYTLNTTSDLALGVATGTAASTTIVKQGTGRLILDNTSSVSPNNFTGTTFDVQDGSLLVIGSSTVGATNPLGTAAVQLNGGTLALDTAVGDVSFDNVISLAGTGGAILAGSGPRTFTLTSTTAIDIGAGQTLTLAAPNGSNSADGGILVLNAPLTGSGNLTKLQTSAGDGNGNGIAALTADSSSFSGPVTVNGGSLEGRFSNAGDKVFGTGAITMAGGQLNLRGANAAAGTSYTPGNDISVTANAGFDVGAASGGGADSDFALGSLTTTGAYTVTLNSTGNYDLSFTDTTLGGNTTFAVNSGALSTGNVSESTVSNLTKTGSGTLVTGAASSYTGTTAINGGVLEASVISDSVPSSLGSGTGTVFLNNGTLRYTGTAAATTTRQFNANNANGGAIDIVDAGASLEVVSDTTATRFLGNAASSLEKHGPGTLILSGSADNPSLVLDAKAGVTELNKSVAGGTRAVSRIGGIDSGATVRLTGAGTDQIYGGTGSFVHLTGGTLDLNGKSESINQLTGTGTITNNGGAATTSILTVGEANQDSAFSGVLTDGASGGKVGLTKIGSGTTTIHYNAEGFSSNYSGGTTISGGTLRLDATPLNPLSGSQLWLDAADISTVTLTGGLVSEWSDKSGNDRHATQGTAAARPGTGTNAEVGGLNVVSFDGGNDLLNVDLSFLAGSEYTIFAVEGRTENDTAYFLGTTSGTGPNRRLHVGYRDTDTFTLAQFSNDTNYDDTGLVYDGVNQVFRQWTASLDTTDGQSIALNGTQVATGPTRTATMITADGGTVGRGFTTGTQFYKGDIGEILIYNSNLSAADRAVIDAYLQNKWFGVTTGFTTSNLLPTDTAVNITASGATLDLNGVDQQIGSLDGVAGSAVRLGDGTLTIDGASSSTFSGVISGTGGLSKAGSGTQTLSGDNDYTGATDISAGTLLINGDQSAATGAVTVASGATLGGAGTLGGDTTISGTLSTGIDAGAGTVGSLAFIGTDLTFNNNSTWLVDIVQGGSPSSDAVTGVNNLDIGSAAELVLAFSGTYQLGNKFTLASYSGSWSGTFQAMSGGNLVTLDDNTEYDLDGGGRYLVQYADGGNSFTLTAIPEPTVLLPLAMLLIASLLPRRRRQVAATGSGGCDRILM